MACLMSMPSVFFTAKRREGTGLFRPLVEDPWKDPYGLVNYLQVSFDSNDQGECVKESETWLALLPPLRISSVNAL
jgi:hypothetical protein